MRRKFATLLTTLASAAIVLTLVASAFATADINTSPSNEAKEITVCFGDLDLDEF